MNPRDITAMAADNPPPPKVELSDSGLTMPSDSENYSTNHEMVSSSPSTSSAPLVLYKPPSFWGMLRGAAINLVLPFVNGLMLGFGELFAHETAFRLGWSNTKVRRLGCYLAYGISSGGIAAAHANTHGCRSSLPTGGHNQSARESKCESFRWSGGQTRGLACGRRCLWSELAVI